MKKIDPLDIITFVLLILFIIGLIFIPIIGQKSNEKKDHVLNQLRLSNEQIAEQYDFCKSHKLEGKTLYTYSPISGMIPTGVECGNFETQKYGDIKKSNITEITIEK